jgi:hypothetical protein
MFRPGDRVRVRWLVQSDCLGLTVTVLDGCAALLAPLKHQRLCAGGQGVNPRAASHGMLGFDVAPFD